MHDRGHLLTEQRNASSADLDRISIAQAFDVMNAADASIAQAVAEARPAICEAVERVVAAFRAGGRLFYIGAGTSGRLGMLDASECPPTFLSDPDCVQGIIAGGREAMFRSIEGAEDDPEAGAAEMDERSVGPNDVVIGIATGGTTPYVHGALRCASRRGASTVFLACVPPEQVPDEADVSIRVLTGPEVITGSTRLKAGLATKMVLNAISTIAMTQVGKVYGNLMVDVNAGACSKLTDRAVRILTHLTDLDRTAAQSLLDRADGRVKTALVMHQHNVQANDANRLLTEHAGRLRAVLELPPPAKKGP